MTVHDLRKCGYKVRVLHHRCVDGNLVGHIHQVLATQDGNVDATGGMTVVQITTPNGIELEGRAKCSNKDRYDKKLGVKVALGRLFPKCA